MKEIYERGRLNSGPIKKRINRIKNREKYLYRMQKEVFEFTDSIGTPIDKAIQPLIVGLKCFGVVTTASCEGHIYKDINFVHPFVSISSESINITGFLVNCRNNRYRNEDKKLRWVFEPVTAWRIRPIYLKETLEDLQKDAVEFGTQLQEIFLQ